MGDQDGKPRKVKTARHGTGKRWLAVWVDPDGKERSTAYDRMADAERKIAAMGADIARGDYIDPSAGKVLFADLAERWLASRIVDPATKMRYEYVHRLHVAPTFAKRQVKSIKPSQIQAWISSLSSRFETSTVQTAFLVLQGILDLAVADEAIKRSPAKWPIVQVPKRAAEEITAWSDERVHALIDAHPALFRLLPVLGAACGLRQGELFGLAFEDIDFEEHVLRVRRQIKKLGADHVFALPKNDRERVVPLPAWAAEANKRHVSSYPPLVCSLPWEKVDGKLRTQNLLFRWTDDRFIKARSYSETVGKPALVAAGVIPAPDKDARQRSRYATSRKEGLHQLRHYYASVMLAGGVSVKELAEYLGHADPGFTLRVYAHMMPGSHDRARRAFDERFFRPHPPATPA
ncbi:tyrosine-type recombinase/integrase [Nonomuraea wenchangensis]|uniref:Site-specific recombinase XerD n=1 Tax=Nonomuraea wenchangensis TaxID=568860 RepID=A0A1I0LAE6_9ACTN|nr:site-specific integrase [Nonomuraea wenchangensis]SEU36999.1 Site-specific recombinase XerD [Nonomuraea wenchangensis]